MKINYSLGALSLIMLGLTFALSAFIPASTVEHVNTTPTKKGKTVSYHGTTYFLYEPDLKTQDIIFHFEGSERVRTRNIGEIKAEYGNRLAFATNGGIFNPNGEPVGLYINQGETIYPLNTDQGAGNFFLKPNGVFYINKYGSPNILSTSKFESAYKGDYSKINYALQSGPMLFTGGNMNSAFRKNSNNRYVRSAVGLLNYKTQQIVFVLSKTPVNFYDFASFLREELDCSHALYLDGNISQMYNPDIGLELEQASNDFSVIISIINK